MKSSFSGRPARLALTTFLVGALLAACSSEGDDTAATTALESTTVATTAPESESGSTTAWNAIAALSDDEVTIIDRETRETLATYPVPTFSNIPVFVGSSLVVFDEAAEEATMIDLTDGTTESLTLPGVVDVLPYGDARFAVAWNGLGAADAMYLIDVDSATARTVIEPDDGLEVRAISVLVNPSGTAAAVPDMSMRSWELLAIDGDTSLTIDGIVRVLDDEQAIAATIIDNENGEVTFYGLDGEARGTASLAPVVGIASTGLDTAVAVGFFGEISTVTAAGDVTVLDELVDEDDEPLMIENGFAIGERVVAFARDRVVIVDPDGGVTTLMRDDPMVSSFAGRSPNQRCIAIETAADDTSDEGRGVLFELVDIESGDVVGSAQGAYVWLSADGCSGIVGSGSGATVVTPFGTIEADIASWIAPDGSAVATGTIGAIQVEFTDGVTAPIELEQGVSAVGYIELP